VQVRASHGPAVDFPWPTMGRPGDITRLAASPLLAQEVFELVHQLLRVEGVVTV